MMKTFIAFLMLFLSISAPAYSSAMGTDAATRPVLLALARGGYETGDYQNCRMQLSVFEAGRICTNVWNEKATPKCRNACIVDLKLVNYLRAHMSQANYTKLRSKPYEDICPTFNGGEAVKYIFFVNNKTERIDTCSVIIDKTAPLFQMVDYLKAKLAYEIGRGQANQ